jgi:hypothetical protein
MIRRVRRALRPVKRCALKVGTFLLKAICCASFAFGPLIRRRATASRPIVMHFSASLSQGGAEAVLHNLSVSTADKVRNIIVTYTSADTFYAVPPGVELIEVGVVPIGN